jgi:hypothetical protein
MAITSTAAINDSIHVRIMTSMAAHFRQRALSWFSAVALLFTGMTEPWPLGPAALAIALIRLTSLVINGNFPQFSIALYIRIFSIISSAIMWVQLAFTFAVDKDHFFSIGICVLLIVADILSTVFATLDQ